MRRVITIAIIVAFLLSSSMAIAVERRNSGKIESKKIEDKIEKKSSPDQNLEQKKKQPDIDKKDFDNFIDKNSNGIDDRLESRKEEVPLDNKVDTSRIDPKPQK